MKIASEQFCRGDHTMTGFSVVKNALCVATLIVQGQAIFASELHSLMVTGRVEKISEEQEYLRLQKRYIESVWQLREQEVRADFDRQNAVARFKDGLNDEAENVRDLKNIAQTYARCAEYKNAARQAHHRLIEFCRIHTQFPSPDDAYLLEGE
jgi:uncharacterized protein YgfB (UPF0149 family)